jgi:hypothetical protein
MLTPYAFNCIIRHFDEVDRAVSTRLLHKRPWNETALTFLLCELLDGETQDLGRLTYTLAQLQQDLAQDDGLFGIELALETTEFNAAHERYISQSDLGLKLVFDNKIEPELSWTRPYLLQAKRLFPTNANPLAYAETAKFSSLDQEQQKRLKLLETVLGKGYLKYLLYTPRPESIDSDTRLKLAYLRTKSLAGDIFDHTDGLRIYQELLSGGESLKAGIFLADLTQDNLNFGQIHESILRKTFPLSWFIALNFLNKSRFLPYQDLSNQGNAPAGKVGQAPADNQQLVEGILAGDKTQIDELIKRLKANSPDTFPTNIQLLPQHTLTLTYSVGAQLPPDSRRLRPQ